MDRSRHSSRPKPSRSRSPTRRPPTTTPATTASSSTVRAHNNDQNKLRAQILKARLTKAPNLAELERQLQQATQTAQPPSRTISVVPSPDTSAAPENLTAKRPGKEPGDGDPSILQMARAERLSTADGALDRVMAKKIARNPGLADDMERLADEAEKLAEGADRAGRRADNRLTSDCRLCFHSDAGSKVVPPACPVVALGAHVYLALPPNDPLTPGHCLLAPLEHIAGSSLSCSEAAWDELTNFFKSLTHMFDAQGLRPVFFETVTDARANGRARHCTIECIPVPSDVAAGSSAYFRQALLEVAEEWSTHRKVIDTRVRVVDGRRQGGFRGAMSKSVPYFHVWLDVHGGLGHVIEEPRRFPRHLGREVIAGMLDLSPTAARTSRPAAESHDQRVDRATQWKNRFGWAAHDWTAALDDQ
ncbi:Pre-mRNA-splicing factor cwf19 [Coemansia sp. RSA 2603]|nr:Pre-mRNA-splicing factor cwf19 [Coemansia sp. RSA 2603]